MIFRKKVSKVSLNQFSFAKFWPVRITVFLSFVFLYLPILVLIIYSFNDSKRNIVWKGFTLKYYEKLFYNESLLEAFSNSITIGISSTIFSLLIAIICGYSLWKLSQKNKKLNGLYEGVLGLPIVIPEICMGIGFLVLYESFNLYQLGKDWDYPFNLSSIIIAHITFSFPFASMVIRSRMSTFNLEIEEAGLDLGASRWLIFKDLVFPHLRPSLLTAGLLVLVLSLDDFVITFFTSSPEVITLPVKIYSMVRFSITPEVNAASTIFLAITFSLVLLFFISYFYSSKEKVKEK